MQCKSGLFCCFWTSTRSTALGERLGALSMRALVRKFLIDVFTADHRSWGRNLPLQRRRYDCGVELGHSNKRRRRSQDCRRIFDAIERQQRAYERLFGVVPTFRIGIDGGDLGIYGDAINIAARMEDAAAAHGVRCILSEAVAEALADHGADS